MANNTGRLHVAGLRTESQVNPLGMDVRIPRFSWRIETEGRGVMQAAYHVIVRDEAGAEIWNSGKTAADTSLWIAYGGPALQSRQRYTWRVKIWDTAGRESDWSDAAFWEMGLLQPEDWQARWIEPVQRDAVSEPFITIGEMFSDAFTDATLEEKAEDLRPSQMLRRAFRSQGQVAKARLYATSHGLYRLQLNGCRVGDVELAPDFTAYDVHLQYQTYDVTDLLQAGDNALGAVLADGWYLGRIQLTGHSCQFGSKMGLLIQLEIDYEDGTRRIIGSDERFVSSTGPWQYADLFIGERYDARLEQDGWSRAGFNDEGWVPVALADEPLDNLSAQYGPPVRAMKELSPVAIVHEDDRAQIVDFGQIMAGRVRLAVDAPAGTIIRMEHSEVLDRDGRFFMNILGRNKHQTDVYIARGDGPEVYEPVFTFHGFRYVRITGYPAPLRPEDIQAVVLYSDMDVTGEFECSDERLNQLQHNIQWSQMTNMLSIPTDCPQRERAGWTGDIQVFAPTAAFNMDVSAFLSRWLVNVRKEQFPDGQIPNFVPTGGNYVRESSAMGQLSSAGWGDGIVIVPWALYRSYGDVRVLADNYEAMTRWHAYVRRTAENELPEGFDTGGDAERLARQRYLWNTGFHFGDWLIPSIVMNREEGQGPMDSALLTKELVATCCYAYSSQLLADISDVLGKPEEAGHYRELNAQIRQAFEAEYVADDGRLSSHYQGIYVLALQMNMVSNARRGLLVRQLAHLIEANGDRLDTGFLSVPFLMDVLCREGRTDMAYRLLYQTACPSWLYAVERGATTVWESWSAIAPDGTVGHMSFNHYAFGCIGDWMYRHLAGLRAEAPGYKKSRIELHPDCGLTSAAVRLQTGYGLLASAWSRDGDRIALTVNVPVNTSAAVMLPADGETRLNGGPLREDSEGVIGIAASEGQREVHIGSGMYAFEYQVQ
ncbi:alpha-L-rhamnosidase [Cohnella nanjingensis]|uniref:alpha-L-rhamnosidase n=1 Tax=Cohnella nanjingensis TaxID=1387779 RepID=A0A7X0RUL0_9BACL|nr:alpha-L-rhamnosidase [Cohnella nanjingensis]MBB6672379.1 family 78 glycoside hydrolase catalytic domain [Cohnella nanjingensis]